VALAKRSDGVDPDAWQIGVVAERTGLSMRTLHHWEDVGLVSPSLRTAGGFRLYTEADIERIMTIRRMKPLGFALEEMRDLLAALDTIDAGTEAGAGLDPGVEIAPEQVRAAREIVGRYIERAADGRAALAQRLRWAEEFEELLRGRSAS
jgi:DNA-binding transcriptional MerR regulator